ncbi:MAG: helical backbone metal receptor, partial [Calditrichaceae bacterium]
MKRINMSIKYIFFIIGFCLLIACSGYQNKADKKIRRVISLAPSITEIVYALDQQSKLVAVTDYCNYPPQAKSMESVGGLLNPNLEKIISLKPDILIGTTAHSELAAKLAVWNLKTILLPNDSVNEIFMSVDSIGSILNCQRKSLKLVEAIKDSIKQYKSQIPVQYIKQPEAMLVLGREPGSTRNIGVAGSHNYMDSLWTLMGGRNLFGDL